MKKLFPFVAIALVAGLSGWWMGNRPHSNPVSSSERLPLYYQSPMHPWVKSDKPGKCTVCGMDLVPIYDGGQAMDSASTDIVMLPEGSPNVSNVRTVEVKKQPLVRTLRVAGTIEDDDTRHRVISAYVSGRLEKLFVNFVGDEVEKGQPLATYYSKELLNTANEYRLLKKQPNSSTLLGPVESRLLQMGLTPEQITKLPERSDTDIYFELLAPMTGSVVERFVYEGQYVEEGEKLFEIADFSIMWFLFIAYEQDLPFLRDGLPVTVRTPSLPGRVFHSKITFINPNLDNTTRSAMVRVEIPNPLADTGLHRRHEFLHLLYATGEVHIDPPEVVAVPRNAVLWTGRSPRVYVEESPGVYQQRTVILGRAGDELWEVLEGVKPGERVVASGNMLIDGQAQLNNLAAAAPAPSAAAESAVELSSEDHTAMQNYLKAIAAATDALAEDDLIAYNEALAKIPTAPAGFTAPVPAAANDLAQARKSFFPLSEAVADKSLSLRGHFPDLRIFRCPMSDQADGVPKNSKWIQFSEKLRNPFMGHEMLECGVEVK